MHMLPEIPASDFEALVKMTKELNIEHKHVLTDFYKKDSNCVPAKFIFQVVYLGILSLGYLFNLLNFYVLTHV